MKNKAFIIKIALTVIISSILLSVCVIGIISLATGEHPLDIDIFDPFAPADDTPTSQTELQKKFYPYLHISEKGDAITVFTREEFELVAVQKTTPLTKEEILFLISDSIRLYNEYDTVVLTSANPKVIHTADTDSHDLVIHPLRTDDGIMTFAERSHRRDNVLSDIFCIIFYRVYMHNSGLYPLGSSEREALDLTAEPLTMTPDGVSDLYNKIFLLVPSADTDNIPQDIPRFYISGTADQDTFCWENSFIYPTWKLSFSIHLNGEYDGEDYYFPTSELERAFTPKNLSKYPYISEVNTAILQKYPVPVSEIPEIAEIDINDLIDHIDSGKTNITYLIRTYGMPYGRFENEAVYFCSRNFAVFVDLDPANGNVIGAWYVRG